MTICAIHQPNFFPWAGYFDKIRQADIFIFLDEVAYPKSGSGSGSWCNRVKIRNTNTDAWYGLPICRESGPQLIKNVQFKDKEYNANKLLKTLELNYKKSKNFSQYMSYIESLFNYSSNYLSEFNINAIIGFAKLLGLKTKFVRQSELTHKKHSTELLIELVQQVNADVYLSGNGCSGYMEEEFFQKNEITLIYQKPHSALQFFSGVKPEDTSLSILHLLLSYDTVSQNKKTGSPTI